MTRAWRQLMVGLAVLALLAEVSWAVFVLGLGSDAGLPLVVALVSFWGGVALLVLWFVRLVVYLVATRKAAETRRYRQWAIEPLAVAACVALVWTGLAFRVRFLLSKPALDRYAREPRTVDRAFPPANGPRVGMFRIRESEVLPHGVVRIITTDCGFDDCGLVYTGGGRPPRIGEDSYTALGGGWWQWWRSW